MFLVENAQKCKRLMHKNVSVYSQKCKRLFTKL